MLAVCLCTQQVKEQVCKKAASCACPDANGQSRAACWRLLVLSQLLLVQTGMVSPLVYGWKITY